MRGRRGRFTFVEAIATVLADSRIDEYRLGAIGASLRCCGGRRGVRRNNLRVPKEEDERCNNQAQGRDECNVETPADLSDADTLDPELVGHVVPVVDCRRRGPDCT
jgi:hypothetical protein